MIKMGTKVRAKLSGFTGIMDGYAKYLFRQTRISIKPEGLKDGRPIENEWFDEDEVEEIKAQKLAG